MQMSPIPLGVTEGSMSKVGHSMRRAPELMISGLEDSLQKNPDFPEPRKENTRALIALLREHGAPTPGYVAWANWGRAGTMLCLDHEIILGRVYDRESIRDRESVRHLLIEVSLAQVCSAVDGRGLTSVVSRLPSPGGRH